MSREKLEALDRLQTVDLQIEELTRQADAVPQRLTALAADVAKARGLADAERGRLADNERACREIQQTIEDGKETLKKWEARLPALKQAREYAASEREINSLKKSTEAAELTLAGMEEQGEPLLASLRQKDADVAAAEALLAGEKANLQKNETALRDQAAALQAKRNKVRESVDPKVFATYDGLRDRSIKKGRGGRVVVAMLRDSCTGCNRKLLPRLINSVLNGHIESCPACMRLLYAPPPPPEA